MVHLNHLCEGIFGDYSYNPTTTNCKEICDHSIAVGNLFSMKPTWKRRVEDELSPSKKAPRSSETGAEDGPPSVSVPAAACVTTNHSNVSCIYNIIDIHIFYTCRQKFSNLVLSHVLLHCRKSTLQSN